MLIRILKTGICITLVFFLIPAGLMAAQIKGKIQSISRKAKTIQLVNLKSKQIEIIRFGENTQYTNAKSIKEFIPNDVIKVEYEPGQEAKSIIRVLVKLPPEKVIETGKLASIMQDPSSEYLLVDARPGDVYAVGHIPTAISIPVKKLSKNMHLLPKDKNKLLIFYCGGPT